MHSNHNFQKVFNAQISINFLHKTVYKFGIHVNAEYENIYYNAYIKTIHFPRCVNTRVPSVPTRKQSSYKIQTVDIKYVYKTHRTQIICSREPKMNTALNTVLSKFKMHFTNLHSPKNSKYTLHSALQY